MLPGLCGLTLLTQKSSAFSHGAPAPICSTSTAIFTRPTVSLAPSVIRESITARWAFCVNHRSVKVTTSTHSHVHNQPTFHFIFLCLSFFQTIFIFFTSYHPSTLSFSFVPTQLFFPPPVLCVSTATTPSLELTQKH